MGSVFVIFEPRGEYRKEFRDPRLLRVPAERGLETDPRDHPRHVLHRYYRE